MPVSDAALRDGLQEALGRPVGTLERRAWPYVSSLPMEELVVDGGPPVLFKDLTARARPSRPAFLVDPAREVQAYRDVAALVDAPALHGAVVDGGRTWLFVERVDGVPLWQAHDLQAWEATARWAARMHAAPPPRDCGYLLTHDAAHLRRWVDRALAMAPDGGLDDLRPAAGVAVDRLRAWPQSLLHGELYPSNVLVQATADGPRIRPVDWETAGLGPGLLDLAALTSGAWAAAEREQVVAAYRHELGVVPDGFDGALDAARLLVALQWLGWSASWTPPPEHRHDWAADARAVAARICA
jgi:Ser/Thr protein kinase RdoA (MazF antagonist)